jgi:hypothetical protein
MSVEMTCGSFHADVARLSAPSHPSASQSSASRSEEPTRPFDGASSTPPPASFRTAARDWCVDADTVILTLSTFELWEALERGQVVSWMRVWREGMECWTPVGEISEFAWALAQTPKPLAESPRFEELDLEPIEEEPAAMTPAPRASAIRPLTSHDGRGWIAVGSAVALVAIGFAMVITARRPPPPAETAGAVLQASLPSLVAPVRSEERRTSARARAGHDEPGQRRLPRGGRAIYDR